MTLPGAGSLIHVTNEDFMKNYGIRRFLPVVAVVAMLWASADSQAQGVAVSMAAMNMRGGTVGVHMPSRPRDLNVWWR